MIVLAPLLLVSLADAAPSLIWNTIDKRVTIDKKFFPSELVKYESNHDIVNILVPTNYLNFDKVDTSKSRLKQIDPDIILFFVEADVAADGKRIDKGLYVIKDDIVKKLLDNGRDAAASGDESKLVLFGASDGLYVYNAEKNIAEKYGTVTDSIINLTKEKTGDVIYILTEYRKVYKVSHNGNKKEKVEQIINAQQIVLDNSNNLYFYSDDKQPYVYTNGEIKKIEGLPNTISSGTLVKPPFVLDEGVPFIADNEALLIYPNGTSAASGFEFETQSKPSAYAMEAALIHYHAYDKKIYEYKIVALILVDLMDVLKKFLVDNFNKIQSLAGTKIHTKTFTYFLNMQYWKALEKRKKKRHPFGFNFPPIARHDDVIVHR